MPVYDVIACLALAIPLLALFALEVLSAFARYHQGGCRQEKFLPVETASADGDVRRLCPSGLGQMPYISCNLTD